MEKSLKISQRTLEQKLLLLFSGETKAGITESSLLFLGEKPENGISANDIFDRVCVHASLMMPARQGVKILPAHPPFSPILVLVQVAKVSSFHSSFSDAGSFSELELVHFQKQLLQ